MKQVIRTAIVIGAFPALLSGQSFDCPESTCQVAPYYAGNGGFVGEAAAMDDSDTTEVDESQVNFRVVCGAVTISGSVVPDSGGIVRQALTTDNGFACQAEGGGTLEIDGLKDGGWYWINDATSSAVSALIRKDSLSHPRTMPTDPGGLVLKTVEGGAATFAKHEPSGRVGIIPHIVPRKPTPDCSGAVGGATATDCVLGSAADWSLAASPSSVTRPADADANNEVTVTLMGTKFITTGEVAARAELNQHDSVVGVKLDKDDGAAPGEGGTGVLAWTVTVAPDADRCASANPDRLNAQTITVQVATVAEVIPGLSDDGVETTFSVNCPDDTAANRGGVELVPENPFPVD